MPQNFHHDHVGRAQLNQRWGNASTERLPALPLNTYALHDRPDDRVPTCVRLSEKIGPPATVSPPNNVLRAEGRDQPNSPHVRAASVGLRGGSFWSDRCNRVDHLPRKLIHIASAIPRSHRPPIKFSIRESVLSGSNLPDALQSSSSPEKTDMTKKRIGLILFPPSQPYSGLKWKPQKVTQSSRLWKQTLITDRERIAVKSSARQRIMKL